jgi:hypothetical protein
MEAPLTAGSPYAEAKEAVTDSAQPLPKELRDQIRRYLLQRPSGQDSTGDEKRRQSRQARLLGAALTLWFWIAIIPGFRSFDLAGATQAGYAGDILCALGGVIIGAQSFHFFHHVLPHLLEQLEALVTLKAAATIAKTVKFARWFLLLSVLVWSFFVIEFVAHSDPDCDGGDDDGDDDPAIHPSDCEQTQTIIQWMAAVVVVVFVPLFPVGLVYMFVPQSIAFALAADKVERLATDIQRSTAATADYDAFTTDVFRAHTDTVKLSALMQPQLLGTSAYMLLLTLIYLFCAVGPRPDRGPELYGFGSWYNIVFNEYICVVISTVFAAILVYNLMAPAKVTSACQKIADAVNSLRVTPKADGTSELATADELHRIEGLKRYLLQSINEFS